MWLGFFIGIILGVALLALVMWLRSKAINVTWYEWLIGAIGLALLVFTIQNVFGSFDENEQTAGQMFLLMPGLPAIVLIYLSWQLNQLRRRRSKA